VSVNRPGGLLGRRVLATVGVVLACVLAGPAAATAETFTVNSAGDAVDAVVGNEFCETADGKCTLRAAIEEANSSAEEKDAISFEEGVFDGDSDSVIQPSSALPAITAPLSLSGRGCEGEAGVRGPCVEIAGNLNEVSLKVEGADEVEIEFLSLTGAKAGIEAAEAERLLIRGSWVGIGLDGSLAGNVTGVVLGPDSDRSRIGGFGPEAKNLIGGRGTAGLKIIGSSKVEVLGNEFAVGPVGDQPAKNIVVESTNEADAVGTIIGARVGAAAAASPACELGCNLISGSGASGIDLSGDGSGDPAVETTIVGNHIGLDSVGTGILVGTAPRTVIGGSRAGDANAIAGGALAVDAGSAPYLVIRRNLIGSRVNTQGTAAAPRDGFSIESADLSFPEEAQILENEIGLAGGIGISQNGLGAEISRNLIEGGAIGIEVRTGGFENLIDSNRIDVTGIGIALNGGFNTTVGNEIGEDQDRGIRIVGSGLFGANGNVIGGDSPSSENTIVGSNGAAIEIINPPLSRNEVARNRGAGNDGPFIALIASPADAENLDPGIPNGGILPPLIVVISEAGAAGFAEPGANVRVFGKATASQGEIQSFLGAVTADEDGNWSLTFPTPLSPGAAIGATQTKEEGTSELEVATVPVAPGALQRPPAVAAATAPPGDQKPPRTRMLRQPRRVPAGGVASFAFAADEPGSSFQCSLDGGSFHPCNSPKKYRGLRPGKHVFRVRAVDPAGNIDRTPVRRRFKVLD
jgi:CSLREA domain-containing protein